MTSHFDDLLPVDVKVVEAPPPPWDFALFEEEHQYVARVVAARAQEFAAGRYCARRALWLAGHEGHSAIRVDRHRAPVFPMGFTGSITHTDNYCAAAAVPVGSIASIGIDAELNRPLPTNVLQLVAADEEVKMLNSLVGIALNADTLLFSIKEAIFKAYFNLAKCFLDFHGARVVVHPEFNRFTVTFLKDAAVQSFGGRSFRGSFALAGNLLCSAIAINSNEVA